MYVGSAEEARASCRKITSGHKALWVSPSVQKTCQNLSCLFSVPDFALISTDCRFTVTLETVEAMALTTRPDYRCFSRGHDPIMRARRAR